MLIPTLLRNRLSWSAPSGSGTPSDGAGERPLRAELFNQEQLGRHAKSLAGWHRLRSAGRSKRGRNPLLARLAANEAVFATEYEQITASLKRGQRITPAAEWFIDNYYLIEEQIRTARLHLPRRYSYELPQLANGPSAGLPRVYDMALELISHVDGRVDLPSLRAFVTAYEGVSPLRLGELWAIPIMLRMALLENLRRVVLRQSAGRHDAERAGLWVDQMVEVAASEPSKLVLVLADIVRENPPLTNEFVAEFAGRLRGSGAGLAMPFSWLEHRLGEQERTIEQIFQETSQGQAADQVSIGNSISSLRLLAATDWRDFVEAMSAVEGVLRHDPAGAYSAMDFNTRDSYRHAVETIARRSLMNEEEVAIAAAELARQQSPSTRSSHVGYFLIDRGRAALERAVGMRRSLGDWIARLGRRFALPAYLGGVGLIVGVLTALIVWWAARHGMRGGWLTGIGGLTSIGVSRVAIGVVQWMAALLVRPKALPRLDFSKTGIPEDCRTVVAVPAMLTSVDEINDLLDEMEVRYLANRDPGLSFVLLTDYRDAAQETLPEDAALFEHAKNGIIGLNAKYANGHGSCFFLFQRSRRWNRFEGLWMGWERKRGKLEEFNGFLRGRKSQFQEIVGTVERLRDVKYVITLDADTQLPRDTARQLVGTIAHPLNRPMYDEKRGRVTEGYGILQPLVGDSMPSTTRSLFARLFCGEPGIDPYTRVISDVYQDVFAEGSYVGKGIYDVDAFDKAVGKRLPENRILSHDLLEGSHARAALVSDVVLFEDYPSAYPVDVSRRHRWIRGDWQIASWLLPRVPGAGGRARANPISALSRWKILDNIRRSLVPIALFALLLIGWFYPGPDLRKRSALYTLLVLGIVLIPILLAGLDQMIRQMRQISNGMQVRLPLLVVVVARHLLQEMFIFACLPYEAFLSFDAAMRTIFRVFITHRRLLEWRTNRDVQQSHRNNVGGFYISMWPQWIAALAIGATIIISRSPVGVNAFPILVVWLAAPGIAYALSVPSKRVNSRLSQEDRTFLRLTARRTWRFFETFVSDVDNYLPPDNFQEKPPQGIAHRTSPTNMGLALLANMAAWDFGFISMARMIQRTEQTLGTMDKLARYRGHFYNWYDTRTLELLRPQYVSTVDSGNLAAHLLVLANGLEGLANQPIFSAAQFEGIGATFTAALECGGVKGSLGKGPITGRINQLQNDLRQAPTTLVELDQVLKRVNASALDAIQSLAPKAGEELHYWLTSLADQSRQFIEDLALLAPWVEVLPAIEALPVAKEQMRHGDGKLRDLLLRLNQLPALGQIASMETLGDIIDAAEQEAGLEFHNLREAIRRGAEEAAQRISANGKLAVHCRELADIEFEFLYDPSRRLLALGYHVAEHRLDAGFYDLLASEARLASYVAIAQGKLPQEHWFSLGRQITSVSGRLALVSWSGSMFEYLMPLLVMPTHPDTVLDETYRAVIRSQIDYGKKRGTPWGISESGYNKTDAQFNYQYCAFGVPGLGYKRGLADDLVVAPYASALALMVDPEAACANLQRLGSDGRMGRYGFYEAIDYTSVRLPPGERDVTICSYMAHHQGMSLLSLEYLLLDRPMQARFAADPMFRATELLLHERVPKAPLVMPHPAELASLPVGASSAEAQPTLRVYTTPDTPTPEIQLLSNGNYHVGLTAAGGGYCKWRNLAVTRWHEDTARDCWGPFCYIRDTASGEFWSATYQPTLKKPASYEAIFSQGRVEYRRRDGDLETHFQVAVSPEDDIEMRRLTITNHGNARRTIELTSYREVVMAAPGADAAHPAFSNLFVQTRILRDRQAILCTRRPRSASECPPWMMHLMTVEGKTIAEPSYETARDQFIGRGRSAVDPAAMHLPSLVNTEGAVLDPITAIRHNIAIGPDETVRVNLVTGMAETEEAATSLVEKYHDPRLADRVFELAWTHSQVILHQLNLTEADAQLFCRLASNVLYANPLLRAPASIISRNRRGQSSLWGYGISGDVPIVLLRIGDQASINLVRQLVAAHAYWRVKGLEVDLVIWIEDQSSYRQSLQDQIMAIILSRAETARPDKPGGTFVRRFDQMSEEDRVLMQTVARAIISDTAGTLYEQVNRRLRQQVAVPRFNPARPAKRIDSRAGVEAPRRDLAAYNGIGGFTRDGREYIITTSAAHPTPAPWVNVIANASFGTVVNQSGAAYTWCENAHSYRLTPWQNDWVGEASGEAIYIRDEESGRFWSPTPLPAPGAWSYTTRHGFGYSVFEYSDGEISSELQTYVAIDSPVKFIVLKLRNGSGRTRRLSCTSFFELVLGDRRQMSLPHVVTEVDPKTGALLARNFYHAEFPERVVFLDCSHAQRTVTGDRVEFLGRNGGPANPAAMDRVRLSGRVGAGLDPCAAMQTVVELAQGQEAEFTFIFGSGKDLNEARDLIGRFRGVGAAHTALVSVWDYWSRTLGTVQVQTPDESLNHLANGWLLYQTLACRIWARSGFYQSGGAFGFRDQLQDTCALVHAEPGILRAHLLRCATRQFREGDVQHWWHPPGGRGVRTRISDDFLWLPYAVCRYVGAVGDTGVLDEKVPFLEGRPVKLEEDSYYDQPARSDESATLYEHCVRAIKRGIRFGEHGLPLMGTGDWNDGMNLVGEAGKGESIWLAFFLCDVINQFIPIARMRHDEPLVELLTNEAANLQRNVEEHGWDGKWYRRAYFDDGRPLGSAENPECTIDSLPQSWSIISSSANPDRAHMALEEMNSRLVNRDLRLIQLLEPPFDHSDLNPGYIKGYVPGVRENGGQYTHAAVWAVMAFAQAGDVERAWELFNLINPVHHGDSEAAIHRYKVEPYVAAGDVYVNLQHAGRGGWTWYTGSAGWMYRLILESLLGLRLEVNRVRLSPLIPRQWESFQIHYRYRQTTYHIHIRNLGDGGKAVRSTKCDGVEQSDNTFPLVDDRREHQVEVEVGMEQSKPIGATSEIPR